MTNVIILSIVLLQVGMAYVIFRIVKRINDLNRIIRDIQYTMDNSEDKEVDKLEKFKNLDGFFTQPK
jgi:hypothetical protein